MPVMACKEISGINSSSVLGRWLIDLIVFGWHVTRVYDHKELGSFTPVPRSVFLIAVVAYAFFSPIASFLVGEPSKGWSGVSHVRR